MPTYEITSPSGKVYEVDAPEGATEAEVIDYARSQFAGESPSDPQEFSRSQRFGQGMQDPVNAMAQMAHNVLPESVRGPINRADNWLYDKTGGMVGSYQPDFNQRLIEQEDDYQQSRADAGQSGFDAYRMGGNVAAVAPSMAIGAPAAMGARVAQGVGLGGLMGLGMPVTEEGDFLSQKAEQAGLGALGGGLGVPAAAAIGRVVRPATDRAVTSLMAEGITPSPGQIMGGAFKTAEEKARSIPILGDFITSAHRGSVDQLNRAAYNRAMNPIGIDASGFPVGREGVRMVKKNLGDAYEELLPKLSFKADNEFTSGLVNLQRLSGELEPKYQTIFDNTLQNKLVGKMTPQGLMSGSTLKEVESELGRLAKGYHSNPDFGGRQLGDAIEEMQGLVRQTVERANPQYAEQLRSINRGYANYAIIRNAAARAGTQDGFTASQLAAAGRASDKSVGKGSTAAGQAFMQDLTDPGKQVLAQAYPDSGTPGRLLFDTGALASGFIEPTIPAGLLVGGMPYTRPGQAFIAGLMTTRPQGAQGLADIIRSASPVVGGIGGASNTRDE